MFSWKIHIKGRPITLFAVGNAKKTKKMVINNDPENGEKEEPIIEEQDETKRTVYFRIFSNTLNAEIFKQLSKARIAAALVKEYTGHNLKAPNVELGKEITYDQEQGGVYHRGSGLLELLLPSRLLQAYRQDRNLYYPHFDGFLMKQDYYLKEADIQKLWFIPSHLYKDKQDQWLDKIKFPYENLGGDVINIDMALYNDLHKKFNLFKQARVIAQGQRQEQGEDGLPSLLHSLPEEIGVQILQGIDEELSAEAAQQAIHTAYSWRR